MEQALAEDGEDSQKHSGGDFRLSMKKRQYQLDINLANIRLNSNYLPKIFFEYERDAEGNVMRDGDFLLVLELSVQAEAFEKILEKNFDNKQEKFRKCISPLKHSNDLLNYWNHKQVICIKGRLKDQFNPESYFGELKELELISDYKNEIPEDYDFGLVHYEEDIVLNKDVHK